MEYGTTIPRTAPMEVKVVVVSDIKRAFEDVMYNVFGYVTQAKRERDVERRTLASLKIDLYARNPELTPKVEYPSDFKRMSRRQQRKIQEEMENRDFFRDCVEAQRKIIRREAAAHQGIAPN